jgi:hypothetical protein
VPRGAADEEACARPSADDPNAFIFPARGGGFIDSGNYRNRVLHKLAKDLGLPKLTFHVIRRTIATLAKDKGHVKDIQGMLRHTRLATTTDVYMQSLESGVRSTIDSIHDELRATGTSGPSSPAVPVRTRAGSRNGPLPSSPVSGNESGATQKPVRWVVLEFATECDKAGGRSCV